MDGLSELSGLDLSEADYDSNVVGLEDSESLDDLDLESLEKELELLSGDLEEEEVDEQPDADELNLSDEQWKRKRRQCLIWIPPIRRPSSTWRALAEHG